MRIFVLIVSALLNGCSSAAPVPDILQHTFNQYAILTYDDGTSREVRRTIKCDFREALYRGGDWRFYWNAEITWSRIDEPFIPYSEQDFYAFNNGYVALHSRGDGEFGLAFGNCVDLMGFRPSVSFTSRRFFYFIGRDKSNLSIEEGKRRFAITDAYFYSDPPINNSSSNQ